MGVGDLLPFVSQFGSAGLFVAYLVWKDREDRRERREQAAAASAAELRREEIEKEDVAAREKLAIAMTALSMVIQGRPHV